MNETLRLIHTRTSTRVFSAEPVTAQEKRVIVESALRAPTAGNQVLYTILDVEDQALKDRLAVTCDDQPFIAKAPWVLVFLADQQKWIDVYAAARVEELPGPHRPLVPGLGEFMMACSDALIAAQTAVIAAEALGIGSCYIGDVLENGETHAELFGLPNHVVPVAMVCFGRPGIERPLTPRYEGRLVHTNRYHRLTRTEAEAVNEDLAQVHAPHGFKGEYRAYGQFVYEKKFASAYQAEMNRSTAWWLERWQRPGEPMAAE